MESNTAGTYYQRKFDQSTPGLILFLLDQSSSMKEVVDGVTKAEIGATAINRTIEALIERCNRSAVVVEKAYIGVIGYGEQTRYETIGSVAALNEKFLRTEVIQEPAGGGATLAVKYKVWIEPRAANSTPMAGALRLAAERMKQWVDEYPKAPPPVVINVTDGAPNDLQEGGTGKETRAAAEAVRNSNGSFDRCLLLSVHIGDASGKALLFPTSRGETTGPYEQLLFDISSVVPPELVELGKNKGLGVSAGSRMMATNATTAKLLQILDFGSSAARYDDVT